jgi:hypothetical protein
MDLKSYFFFFHYLSTNLYISQLDNGILEFCLLFHEYSAESGSLVFTLLCLFVSLDGTKGIITIFNRNVSDIEIKTSDKSKLKIFRLIENYICFNRKD